MPVRAIKDGQEATYSDTHWDLLKDKDGNRDGWLELGEDMKPISNLPPEILVKRSSTLQELANKLKEPEPQPEPEAQPETKPDVDVDELPDPNEIPETGTNEASYLAPKKRGRKPKVEA